MTVYKITEININASPPNSGRREKINLFFFKLLCGISKGFMKALKVFIKRFDAPQKSVRIKI